LSALEYRTVAIISSRSAFVSGTGVHVGSDSFAGRVTVSVAIVSKLSFQLAKCEDRDDELGGLIAEALEFAFLMQCLEPR
jgi:hypothetical protein